MRRMVLGLLAAGLSTQCTAEALHAGQIGQAIHRALAPAMTGQVMEAGPPLTLDTFNPGQHFQGCVEFRCNFPGSQYNWNIGACHQLDGILQSALVAAAGGVASDNPDLILLSAQGVANYIQAHRPGGLASECESCMRECATDTALTLAHLIQQANAQPIQLNYQCGTVHPAHFLGYYDAEGHPEYSHTYSTGIRPGTHCAQGLRCCVTNSFTLYPNVVRCLQPESCTTHTANYPPLPALDGPH